MMAPATIGSGICSAAPTPISATPTVPAVDQDDPVPSDTIEQMIIVATRKIPGESTLSP
jgi:hypothetical protein